MRFKLLQLYRRYRENLVFGAYLFLVVFLAPRVARVIGDGWERSQLVRSLFELATLANLDSGLLVLVGVGLVGALIGLMMIDRKNRPQGLALGIGFGIVVTQLLASGRFIPTSVATNDLGWVLLGAVGGFVTGGGVTLLRLRSLGPQEFRRAPGLLSIVLSGVLILALVEIHVEYPQLLTIQSGSPAVIPPSGGVSLVTEALAANAVITVGAVATVRQFTGYDADTDFFVLGPPASGKSLLLIGAYLEALDNTNGNLRRSEALNPSQDLMGLIENLDRDDSEWIVEATGRGEVRTLEFKYVQGSLLRQNVTISALDYAGEHLTRLPDALNDETRNADEDLGRIAGEVEGADTLILLIDAERFVNNEGLNLAEYFEILESVENRDVILVATKSDIFADMFWEEYERTPQDNFDEFRSYVEERLTDSEQFASLVRETPTSEIHPVYYETEFNEDGERVPFRDGTGPVVTVGFEQLLAKLGR